jgi:hypothetical protein
LIKTLILEENVEIFRVINSYIARAIDDHELCARLIWQAQQIMTGLDRPLSPVPKNKKQLLQFVNSLTRYHFKDKDDIELLNRLITEENEFVLSCFDVFDSDKDHENLIDSLQRILDKYRAQGFGFQRITPSSFYQQFDNNPAWNTINEMPSWNRANDREFRDRQQPIQAYGLSSQMNK